MKDYYKILGVEKTAAEEDIKKAYRKLAHQHHPDRAGGSEQKFKEINEAYQVLSNKEKRGAYDRFGPGFESARGGAGPFGGFPGGGFGNGGGFDFGFGFDPSNLEDMGNVSEIFDAFFEGLGIKRRKTYKRGADMEVAREITLEEAFTGVKSKLEFKTFVTCAKCKGAGHFADEGFSKCSTCDGHGEVRESRSSFFGNFSQVRPCAKCAGTGEIPKKPCGECAGAGRVAGVRFVEVAIAPGISDGQIIKIVGAGEAGERGAGTGDLYVRVRVKPHARFTRAGDDLVLKAQASVADVLLGTPVEVAGISGKNIKVPIPEGFNFKNKIKAPHDGMPKLGSSARGDLYIDLEIKTPKNISSAARALLEKLKGEME